MNRNLYLRKIRNLRDQVDMLLMESGQQGSEDLINFTKNFVSMNLDSVKEIDAKKTEEVKQFLANLDEDIKKQQSNQAKFQQEIQDMSNQISSGYKNMTPDQAQKFDKKISDMKTETKTACTEFFRKKDIHDLKKSIKINCAFSLLMALLWGKKIINTVKDIIHNGFSSIDSLRFIGQASIVIVPLCMAALQWWFMKQLENQVQVAPALEMFIWITAKKSISLLLTFNLFVMTITRNTEL